MSASGAYVEYILALRDEFSAAAERIGKMAAEAKKAIGNLGKTANEIDGQMNKAAAAVDRVASAAKKAVGAVGDFSKANSRAAQDAARANEIWIKEQNRIEKMQQRVLERQTAMNQLREKGLIPAKGGGGGLERGIGLWAFAGMGDNKVLEKNIDYENQVRLLRGVLMDASPQTVQNLRDAAADISRGGVFSQAEVMEAFKDLAGKGVSAKDMPMMTQKVVDIATGAGEDLKKTLDAHLDIVRQFNLGLDKLPHISDTIATAQMKSGASLENSRYYFQQAGVPADIAGVSFEDTTVMEEMLALKGLKGTFAGTGVKMMLAHLQSWTKKQTGIYKDLNISKDDIVDSRTGHLKDLKETLIKLRDATTPEKLAGTGKTRGGILADLFGARAALTVAALMQSLDKWDELKKGLEDASGNAEKMGAEGLKGLAAASKQAEAAWNSMEIAIGKSGFNEQMESVLRIGQRFMDWISGVERHGSRGLGTTESVSNPAILKAAGWAAMAGEAMSKLAMPLLTFQLLGGFKALGGLGSKLEGIGSAMIRIAGAEGAAASITRIATALRALTGISLVGGALFVAYEVYQHWDDLAKAITRVKDALAGLAHGDTSGVKQIAKDVVQSTGAAKQQSFAGPHVPGSGYWQATHPSASGAAAAANSAEATRIKVESTVKATLDPLKVDIPGSVTLQGTLTGPNGASAQVTGRMPISASSPRGTTMADPAAPVVSK